MKVELLQNGPKSLVSKEYSSDGTDEEDETNASNHEINDPELPDSPMTFEEKDELLEKSQMPVLHKFDSMDNVNENGHDSSNQEEINDPESPLLRAGTYKEDEDGASNQEEINDSESPLSRRANTQEGEENEETENLKIENVRGQCPVCDMLDSTENIRKHAVKYFESELKGLMWERKVDDFCSNCPCGGTFEALNHFALEHGGIDKLLNDQSLIAEKRDKLKSHYYISDVSRENLKNEPGYPGSIQNIFYCDLCDIAFISEDFVTEHIRKHHKILKKDLKQFVTNHCL